MGIFWTCYQLVAETSTGQHTTLTNTDIHARGGIRTRSLSKPTAAYPRLKPRGHLDRYLFDTGLRKITITLRFN